MRNKFEKVFNARNQRVRGLWKRNNRFYAQIRKHADGAAVRMVLPGVTTVPQAIQAMGEKKSQRDRGELSVKIRPNAASFTVTDAVDQYVTHLEAMDGKRPKSQEREKVSLKNWKAFCGDTPLADIKRPTLFQYSAWRKQHITRFKTAVSGRCIDIEVSCMMNVLRKYHNDGTLKGGLFALDWEKLAAPSKKKRLLSADEIKAVQKAALERYYGQQLSDFIELLRLTGMREQEGMTCRWSGVDWDNLLFTIVQTKNGEEPRILDMHEELVVHLRAMESRRVVDQSGQPLSAWLFPSPKPGACETLDARCTTMHKGLYSAQARAGVAEEQRWAFHHLRHYFISWAVMSGIDWMTIAKWVGHKDGGVLIGKVYGKTNDHHAKAQSKRLSFRPKVVEAPLENKLGEAA